MYQLVANIFACMSFIITLPIFLLVQEFLYTLIREISIKMLTRKMYCFIGLKSYCHIANNSVEKALSTWHLSIPSGLQFNDLHLLSIRHIFHFLS
jgi:hypothetical protein